MEAETATLSRPAAGCGPLARYSVFRTGDLGTARDAVARIYKPHRLEFDGGDRVLAAEHRHVSLGPVSFNYLTYGGDIAVDPGALDSFFLVMLPVSGLCEVECGSTRREVAPGHGAVISPTLRFRSRWRRDARHLMLQIRREALERHLEALEGWTAPGAIEFDVALDAGGPLGRFIRYACEELDRDDPLLLAPAAASETASLAMSALLSTQPRTRRDLASAPPRVVAPYYVKRVEDHIQAHPERALTMEELAAVAGTSVRTVFEGFRQHRGIGPMGYLRAVRLDRVRRDLMTRSEGTVTEIAGAWGFAHHGHFADAYRRRFGETPSATLNRVRRRS